MITNGFLYLIFGIVWAITAPLRLLDDTSLPEGISSAIVSMGGYLTSTNQVLPVATIISVLGIILLVETSIFVYKVIMWLIRRLPTQS